MTDNFNPFDWEKAASVEDYEWKRQRAQWCIDHLFFGKKKILLKKFYNLNIGDSLHSEETIYDLFHQPIKGIHVPQDYRLDEKTN